MVLIFISDKVRLKAYDYLSTASISELLSIPKPTLVKMLYSLSVEGIIETKEGKHGGIRLAKDPKQITVLDVYNAIERGKPIFQKSFNILAKGKRPDNAKSVITNLLENSENTMKSVLAQKTIAQLLIEMDS